MAGLLGRYICVLVVGSYHGLLAPAESIMKLEQAHVIFRHGDRSPLYSFPNNTCEGFSCWPFSRPGYLTKKGMQQSYLLGQYLKYHYRQKHGLLNSTFYVRDEVYVRSADLDRNLMSAQAVLAGLYPPEDFQRFEPSLAWQPIPVHTVPQHNDSLLRAFDRENNLCPRYTEIYNSRDERSDYREMNEKNQGFFEWVQKEAGVDYKVTLSNIKKIEDPLFCQDEHNMPMPDFVTDNDTVLTHLEELSDYDLMSMFQGNESLRLTAGPLVSEILDHIRNKTDSTDTEPASPQKLYLYSGDDTTVAMLLSAFKVYDGSQPTYASAVMIELYNDQTLGEGRYIRLLYSTEFNGSHEYVQDLTEQLPGHYSLCPLDFVRKLLDPLVPTDWASECNRSSHHEIHHNKKKEGMRQSIVIGISCMGALVVLGLVILAVTILYTRKKSGYQPLLVNTS